MTILAPQRTPQRQAIPPRKRTWSGLAVAAGAFALVLLIALPTLLLRGGDADPTPPATNPPAPTTTTEAPTTTPAPTSTSGAPSSTQPTDVAPAVTELWADLPGGAQIDGAIVVETPLMITGRAQGATEVSVNGTIVPVVDDFFEANVDLTPGVNEITIGDEATALAVTYIPGGTVEFAFLTTVTTSEIIADYAQWLTGDEANQAAFEDGEIPAGDTVPNGYYIRNQNPQLRTLPLAENTPVMLPTPAFGSVEVAPIAVSDWLAMFQADGSPWNAGACDQPDGPLCAEPHFGYLGAGEVGFGYWLTLDTDGTVVQIVGQYRP